MNNLKNNKEVTLVNWRQMALSKYITSTERKEGIRVTFVSDSPREEDSRFGLVYVWDVLDSNGNARYLSGSFNFLRHLVRFVEENNILDLTGVVVDIQQVGEGIKTRYILNKVEGS